MTELYLLAMFFFFRAGGQIVTTANGVFIVGGWAWVDKQVIHYLGLYINI